ncbi:MAG: thiamine pyrophosphate-dependent dehydrogenase E1 component subunit alpha [SAR202 cluster bacterium]|nr:thiamine pyrophosphate-dependent dehydrogenase E1 component subunit alpha [SAR202 cluster bacterium]
MRRVQEALVAEYHPADEIRCPVHFCIGQEAPPAGVAASLRSDDYVFTGHRSHGYYMAKGGGLNGLFAELYGKSTGSNHGKAGHHELSDESVNFYSGAIVAGTIPIAAGSALAAQMRGSDQVTVAVFGDGAADQGILYETLNFAALKNLPMVFICENNLYSTYSRQTARQVDCDIAGRSKAFGVPSRRMYGNDALGIFRAARQAIARARRGQGPYLFELETYRWLGHVGPEDDDYLNYRPMDELDSWKKRCPIEAIQGTLMAKGILDDDRTSSLENQIAEEIRAAFQFAKSSPFPTSNDLLTNVFSDKPAKQSVELEALLELPFDFSQAETAPLPY